MKDILMTIERHIIEEQRLYGGKGDFSSVLTQIVLAAKVVSAQVSQAGLTENILGSAGAQNITGDEQQKLDVFADRVFINALSYIGKVCVMASEEDDDIVLVPDGYPKGEYVVMFDPLDGSSNIDVNVSIGTIFSILQRRDDAGAGKVMDHILQPGYRQIAAGYVIYSSSTVMAYTTGYGVHMFTLDPSIGAFRLVREHVTMPTSGKTYSVNEAYSRQFPKGIQDYLDWVKTDKAGGYGLRYIGSLVADFHRTLLHGGVFLYPPTLKAPKGKLRLLYEANPLAMIAEQAGGTATDGKQRILDKIPTSLHERTTLIIGSKDEVERVLSFWRA